ncbi:unnamed protein product [Blepharisma stoltei]|uniref:Transmembrane protein 222 n=1 Tax=Blepharisma stoltei TaxID=1481888 RepID=A0AAU9J3N8_9CILI|nr:unnamed protein product [Blepharisma stoltei]
MKPTYLQQTDENLKEKFDFKRQRFPYSVVWTPLPLITALIPFIGHTGICSSEGVIHDFSGPYTVSVDDMAFGNPTKYVPLECESKKSWDEAVDKGDGEYSQRMHNLCCDNCHSHVAYVLNQINFEGGGWNMISIWWLCIRKSHYVGISGFIKTYAGFAVVIILIMVLRMVLS